MKPLRFSWPAVILLTCGPAISGEVNLTISPQISYFPSHAEGTIEYGKSVELKLDAYHDFDAYRAELEVIARADADDKGRRLVEARQAYLRRSFSNFDFYIGQRQTFWGKAESRNVVDVINQSDAAANQGSEAKLGAPSLSLDGYFDFGDLQLWYISQFRERTFNDKNGHPSSGLNVTTSLYERSEGKEADDIAARFSTFSGDWDFAVSGFKGTAREPLITPNQDSSALNATYMLQETIGFEAQFTGDPTLLKWESLHGTQSGAGFDAAVAGLEYTLYGAFGQVWDLGLIAEGQYDTRPQAAAERFYSAGLRLVLNDVKDTSFLALISQDQKQEQSLIAFEASRRLNDWSSLELRSQFYDAQKNGLAFSGIADDDVISLTVNMFF
jgi:hypothetical protein